MGILVKISVSMKDSMKNSGLEAMAFSLPVFLVLLSLLPPVDCGLMQHGFLPKNTPECSYLKKDDGSLYNAYKKNGNTCCMCPKGHYLASDCRSGDPTSTICTQCQDSDHGQFYIDFEPHMQQRCSFVSCIPPKAIRDRSASKKPECQCPEGSLEVDQYGCKVVTTGSTGTANGELVLEITTLAPEKEDTSKASFASPTSAVLTTIKDPGKEISSPLVTTSLTKLPFPTTTTEDETGIESSSLTSSNETESGAEDWPQWENMVFIVVGSGGIASVVYCAFIMNNRRYKRFLANYAHDVEMKSLKPQHQANTLPPPARTESGNLNNEESAENMPLQPEVDIADSEDDDDADDENLASAEDLKYPTQVADTGFTRNAKYDSENEEDSEVEGLRKGACPTEDDGTITDIDQIDETPLYGVKATPRCFPDEEKTEPKLYIDL